MNRLIWLTPFLLLPAVWITVEGCRTLATPTFPVLPTATFTITSTPTNTLAVPTNTRTQTYTPTITSTPTNSSTPTITPTVGGPTNTPTFTPANTNTPTDTNSPTNSPTQNNTSTPTTTPTTCSAAATQASEGFESGLDCWKLNPTTYVTSYGVNTVKPHTGSNSLQAVINNTSGASQNIQFALNFASGQNLTGYEMIAYVWVDGSLLPALTSYSSGLQPFDLSPAFQSQYINAGTPSTNVNAWVPVTLVFGAQGDVASNVTGIGVQITGISAGATGNIYLDDITIKQVPVPQWTYEGNTVQNWSYAATSTGTGTVAVTTLASISPPPSNPGANSSLYGLAINLPAGAITGANNEFMAEVNSTAGDPTMGTGMNWVSLNLTSVTIQYWISSSIGSYASTLYPYVRAGTGPNNYGGTYSYTGNCGGSGGCAYVAANTWLTTSFTPSGVSWTTDETNVVAVGADINLTANPTFAGGSYVIDNILLQ